MRNINLVIEQNGKNDAPTKACFKVFRKLGEPMILRVVHKIV